MKNYHMLFLYLFFFCLVGCTSDEEKTNDIDLCPKIDQSKILTEEELKTTCNSISVYRYKRELFLQCQCCLCFKLDVPKNCEGIPVCENYEDCQVDFIQNAEYLFSMIDE